MGRCRRNRKVSPEPLHTYKRRVLHGVSLVGTIVKEAVAVFDRVPQAWNKDIDRDILVILNHLLV